MMQSSNKPDLSIVIISFNTCDLTIKCIDSIYRYLDNYNNYEIICFDNNSNDNSADEISKRFPKVVLIRNKENIGFGKANNRCFDIVRGDNILLLNSDTEMIDGSIFEMVDYLRWDKNIAVVGGKLTYPNGQIQINFGKFPTFLFNNVYSRLITAYILKLFPPKKPKKVDYVTGAYFLIKKEILDEIGYFDERFWMYYEEIDLCRRIKQKGYNIYYYPGSTVIHHGNRASSERQRTLKKEYRNQFYKKHYGKFVAKIISLFEVK